MHSVLISRDYRKAKLIDIDGASQGSIQFPSEYINGGRAEGATSPMTKVEPSYELHKPALKVDLATLLPLIVQQLILGKGRGRQCVTDTTSRILRSPDEQAAKAVIKEALLKGFFPQVANEHCGGAGHEHTLAHKHLAKLIEWFYAVLLRRVPWNTWTADIYDAMRCIDHLPIA